MSIAVQFLIQPTLHYWQPFFEHLDGEQRARDLGLVFSLYCATNAAFSFVYAGAVRFQAARKPGTVGILFAAYAASYWMLGHAEGFRPCLFLFCMMQGLLTIARTSLEARYKELVTPAHSASMIGFLSFVSRLGMIVSLSVAIPWLLGETPTAAPAGREMISSFSNIAVGVAATLGIFLLVSMRRAASPTVPLTQKRPGSNPS